MKRSEAIEIIQTILEEVTYIDLARERAYRLLYQLEEAGMSPPLVMKRCGCCISHDDWEAEE